MNIVGKVKSWSKSKNKDCFKNGIPEDVDHIYPLSKGGSNILENKQILSKESNFLKGQKTKGKIGTNWRFSILQKTTSEGKIYGTMCIRHKDWEDDEWKEVIPVWK